MRRIWMRKTSSTIVAEQLRSHMTFMIEQSLVRDKKVDYEAMSKSKQFYYYSNCVLQLQNVHLFLAFTLRWNLQWKKTNSKPFG